MRTLLTVLILLIGVYGYPYTKTHVAPSPQFRYIDLELQQPTLTQSQPTYYENYHSTSPQKQISREYSLSNQITTSQNLKKNNKSSDVTIFTPFSSTTNDLYPTSYISTKGVDFGIGDNEFGTTDWGDGEGDEPGYDPYPISGGMPFLILCIILYGIIITTKKNKYLQNKNNHHEKQF